MSITELMEWKQSQSEKRRTAITIAVHCAPTLKGSKIANIMTIEKKDFPLIKEALSGSGISYRILKSRGDKRILYLYRKEALQDYLGQPEIRNFLQGYGYTSDDLPSALTCLAHRIFFYGNGEAAFPHEIGIFLGYPLGDVRGFLENDGQNYEYAGYWKVYENVRDTKRLFRRFEKDREDSVNELLSGKTIRDIAV